MPPTHRTRGWSLAVTTTQRSRTGTAVRPADPCAVQISPSASECGTTISLAPDGAASGTGLIVVNLKKILTWAGIALLLFFLVTQPTQSAGLVNNILNTFKDAAEALITFVKNLF